MTQASTVVEKAEAYYDSDDADNFYSRVWGGEDIHVGIYQRSGEPIREASQRTVERMAGRLADLPAGAAVLDVGAGYGGSARYLARENGYKVTCLNLSKVQNQRNRRMNEEQDLAPLIDVVDGSFESLPFEDGAFDAAWSQDAVLHSGDRMKVFREVDRVLKPGGGFVLTDPMQAGNVDLEQLQPVLDRIHLDTMGSVDVYRGFADELGWETVAVERMPEQLVNHYSSVLAVLESRADELRDVISPDYLANMMKGLRHWIEAGHAGRLDWGILHFRKR